MSKVVHLSSVVHDQRRDVPSCSQCSEGKGREGGRVGVEGGVQRFRFLCGGRMRQLLLIREEQTLGSAVVLFVAKRTPSICESSLPPSLPPPNSSAG